MKQIVWYRYNTSLVQQSGYNYLSAIWASNTYTSSPQGPYSLSMQTVRCHTQMAFFGGCEHSK